MRSSGHRDPLAAVPGTLAVGIDPDDPSPRKGGRQGAAGSVSTLRPWKTAPTWTSNEIRRAPHLHPVFLKGGLIWTGFALAQGNGEVNLTAVECSFQEIRCSRCAQGPKLTWPRIGDQDHFHPGRIRRGSDEGLSPSRSTRRGLPHTSKGSIVRGLLAGSIARTAASARW